MPRPPPATSPTLALIPRRLRWRAAPVPLFASEPCCLRVLQPLPPPLPLFLAGRPRIGTARRACSSISADGGRLPANDGGLSVCGVPARTEMHECEQQWKTRRYRLQNQKVVDSFRGTFSGLTEGIPIARSM